MTAGQKSVQAFIWALCLMAGSVYAQSSLPACQGSNASRWTNCFGTETGTDRSKYTGEWKGGNYHGMGTFTSANGRKYVGEFKDGMPDGKGTVTTANGEMYAGELKDGKRNGQGAYTLANGENYVGEFKDNNFNGQGAYTSANGDKYVGEFKDNNINGQGTAILANGEKYVGEFKDSKRNGQGIEYASSGSITRQGRWENNSLVQSFAIDSQRFPFNAPTQTAQPSRAETDRINAEVQAARQQELEQRLATQAIEAEAAKRRQQELEAQLAAAQSAPQTAPLATNTKNERRVALVIGNAAYKVNPLKNPVNDSNDMARSLRAVGFDVIEANNTTLVAMREATRRFADKLVNSDVGLVYYSGHGVEVKGKNYLIPVNADIKREYEVVDQAFDASQFLEMMDSIRGPNNKRVNILLVDACRNNELQKSWRTTNNGLARMDAPGGTFISFATAPGRVAADGVGRNSPYTKHLLQALKQPNMPIEQVFKVVRRNVMDETKGEQVPWDNSSLVGDFFFTVQK
jgi:hypothetical protein